MRLTRKRCCRASRSVVRRGAIAVETDVSDPASVEVMVRAAVDSFGAVDILINNAGIFPMLPLADLDLATFRRVIDINLTGLFLCTKAAASRPSG